jgi:hypothetical protein
VDVLEAFLAGLGNGSEHVSDRRTLGWLWEVSGARLCEEFLRRFAIHPQCRTLDAKRVIDFIRGQNTQEELTTWTVALVNNSQVAETHTLAGCAVGLTERAGEIAGGVYSTSKANIQSPSHQAFDLAHLRLDERRLGELIAKKDRGGQRLFGDNDEMLLRRSVGLSLDKIALAISKQRTPQGSKPPENPHGRIVRELRPVTHGLLLIYALTPPEPNMVVQMEPPYIGLAFSFPSSHTARSVSYEANKVLIQELQDGYYED